ncbi:MAG TPA: response regulator, partial [Planctomycetota bacterium]|nr:response regulator [Planctomycetota bacterium]
MVSANTTARRELHARTVVCLDDDPQVLTAIRRLLRREPVDLLTTDNPETALDWVRKRDVDLLITDLKMPAMDGSDVVRIVEERSPRTKSLILTGYPETAPVTPRIRAGRRQLLTKPWNDDELKQAIRDLTEADKPSQRIPYVLLLPPEPKVRLVAVGSLTAVEHLTPDWFDVVRVQSMEEGLAIVRESDPPVDILFVASKAADAAVAREMAGVYKTVLVDEATPGQLREWYDAGFDQILRRPIADRTIADILRRCVPAARTRALEAREKAARPPESRGRRLLGNLRSTWEAPPGSRQARMRWWVSSLTLSLLIGILLAVTLNGLAALVLPGPRDGSADGLVDRWMRSMSQDSMMRRWMMQQQLDLGRDMNDQTRRFYDEQLRRQALESLRPR